MTNREAAIRIVRRLRAAGYEALLAGGCVRDMLLRRAAKDHDVVTNARPEEIKQVFRWTLEIGAKFGVVVVRAGGQQIEVATFRTEEGYTDGRHPDRVEYADARADAMRRDFTINGMFYDPVKRRVIDLVGGKADLRRRLLRTIGDPNERFGEDYLRMLRAVRFAVQLDFEVDPATWQAVTVHAGRIRQISGERIAIEVEAILTHPRRGRGAAMLVESGLAGSIFPGFGGEQAKMGAGVVASLPERVDFALALAALLGAVRTESAMLYLEGLRLSNAHAKQVRFLMEGRGVLADGSMPLAQLKTLVASPYFRDLYELHRALFIVHGEPLTELVQIRRRAEAIAEKDIKPRPLLNGHELIALGVQPGPTVGLVAQEMYVAQLGETITTAEEARQWVRRWLANHKDTHK